MYVTRRVTRPVTSFSPNCNSAGDRRKHTLPVYSPILHYAPRRKRFFVTAALRSGERSAAEGIFQALSDGHLSARTELHARAIVWCNTKPSLQFPRGAIRARELGRRDAVIRGGAEARNDTTPRNLICRVLFAKTYCLAFNEALPRIARRPLRERRIRASRRVNSSRAKRNATLYAENLFPSAALLFARRTTTVYLLSARIGYMLTISSYTWNPRRVVRDPGKLYRLRDVRIRLYPDFRDAMCRDVIST